MRDFEKLVIRAIHSVDPEQKLTEEQLGVAIQGVLPILAKDHVSRLIKKSAPMLRKKRRELSGFRSRHLRRWERPLNLLETLMVIAQEAGQEFIGEFRESAIQENDNRLLSIVGLHARALLAANEILVLLQNGYADGALGRWRSLHELAVIAVFLSRNNVELAERYVASRGVHSYHAMRQYKEYQEAANLTPFTDESEQAIIKSYEWTVQKYGKEIDQEYGWAKPAFPRSHHKIKFFDLEKSVGLDHWRPRYRWASQYNHGNYKPPPTLLAMTGADENLLLVGPSNGGLTDPAHMMATSLCIATKTMLGLKPTVDNIIISYVLDDASEKVGDAFWRSEQRLLRWDAAKKAEKRTA